MTTANLKLPLITESQASKHITHNEALQILDVYVKGTLKSVTVNTPPATPNTGDAYFIPSGATGDWSAYVGFIAHWYNETWYFYEVPLNITIYIEDDGVDKRYNGSTWDDVASSSGGGKVYVDAAGGATTLDATQSAADIIQIGGTGVDFTLTVEALEKLWVVVNDSDANITLTTGAGATVFLENGQQTVVVGDGTGIRTAFSIAPNGIKVGNTFTPPIYSVSSAPPASGEYGNLIFVTNGDAGSPCLAASDGSSWLKIPLTTVISDT